MSLGMAMSRRYWEAYGRPAMAAYDPALFQRMAAGLVGEGSECFGYDDLISQDHDWGAGFCVWLSAEDMAKYGQNLQKIYDALPDEFEGYPMKYMPERVGVFEMQAFFQRFIGRMPETVIDWLKIPEYALAVCTNGEIFHDPSGTFTELRQRLRDIPEPVRQKKIAAHCVQMMQSGQYNLLRCQGRNDVLAAAFTVGEFAKHTAKVLCLLYHQWPPFYKWQPELLRSLPEPVPEITQKLTDLLGKPGMYMPDVIRQNQLVADICHMTAELLRQKGLTEYTGCDMQQVGLDIQRGITNSTLRSWPVLIGG